MLLCCIQVGPQLANLSITSSLKQISVFVKRIKSSEESMEVSLSPSLSPLLVRGSRSRYKVMAGTQAADISSSSSSPLFSSLLFKNYRF